MCLLWYKTICVRNFKEKKIRCIIKITTGIINIYTYSGTCRCLNNRQAFRTDIHFIFYPEVQKSNSYCVVLVAVRSEDDVHALQLRQLVGIL